MSDDIKKGLLGIVVDETTISQVMPEINSLTYRGYAVQDLCEKCSFEEVAYLVLNKELPKKNQLKNHLINDLKTIGVDKKLKNTVYSFEYNKVEQLLKLIKSKKIGIVKMEVARNNLPNTIFLKDVPETTDDITIDQMDDPSLKLYKDIPREGLNATLMGENIYKKGSELLDISTKGLNKRGYLNSFGQDESVHLEKLKKIIKEQKTPADILIEEFNQTQDINSIVNQRYY